jgi:tetratricopeptide (TPR) repeat protein
MIDKIICGTLALATLVLVLAAGCAAPGRHYCPDCAAHSKPVVRNENQPDLGPYELEQRINRLKELTRQKQELSALKDQANKDYVLENMLLAKTAVDAQEPQTAKECLRRVISFYDTFSTEQKRAGSTSLAEKEIHRFFKGEPFERSFVYFYYGLLHLAEGDAQEAGRSFYSAIAADAAFADAYSHDNALFYYFLGQAYHARGDFGNAGGAFANCERLLREQGTPLKEGERRMLGLPSELSATSDALKSQVDANVIVLIELGFSPNKTTEGAQNQRWRYYSLPGRAQSAVVSVDGRELGVAVPVCDTFFQASTAGRASDKVALQDVKSFTKSVTIFIPYGGGFLSTLWEVEGDKRTWTNLPQQYHLCAFKTENPNAQITIEFRNKEGTPIRNLSQKITATIAPGKLNLITTKFYETRN